VCVCVCVCMKEVAGVGVDTSIWEVTYVHVPVYKS
jgi:hypothetical protein